MEITYFNFLIVLENLKVFFRKKNHLVLFSEALDLLLLNYYDLRKIKMARKANGFLVKKNV